MNTKLDVHFVYVYIYVHLYYYFEVSVYLYCDLIAAENCLIQESRQKTKDLLIHVSRTLW